MSSAMSYWRGGNPIPSFVRAPVATMASFSFTANFTTSTISAVDCGRAAAAGSFPSIAYAASSSGIGDDVRRPDNIRQSRSMDCACRAHAREAPARHWAHANFSAAFGAGKNFAGIQQTCGVECVTNAPHQIQLIFSEQKRHQAIFFHAHAVFAGDGTAHFDAEADDFFGGGDGALKLFFFARIEKNDGMEVAVAGMKNIADFEIRISFRFR